MSKLSEMWETFKAFAEAQLSEVQRKVKMTDEWDGSPSRWGDDAAGYCSACLIDVSGDTKTKDKCFLPVRGPDTPAGTMESKAVMAAAGGRGISRVKKPNDVSQEDWDKAVTGAAKKLAAAYKEMEMEVPPSVEAKMRAMSMDTLQEMAYQKAFEKYPLAMMHSVFVEDDGRMFALLSQGLELYRSELTLSGDGLELSDWQEVTQEFVPKTRTQIIRQDDGKARWLSISATATINRVGEIDSRTLFDNFVKHAEETGEYPVRRFFHQDGEKFITGQYDFLARAGNCYVTSGYYNDSFLAQREIETLEREPGVWGESIGYLPLGEPEIVKIRGLGIPVYQDGINTEISLLPRKDAASLFVRTEVKRQMGEKQLQALAALAFGGDTEAAQKWIEENPDEVNRQIDQNGLITRAAGETEKTEEVELTEELVAVIVQRMAENEVVKTLRETVDAQAATIQTLQGELEQLKVANANFDVRLQPLERSKTEIERQARLDLPAAATVKVGFKPSTDRGVQQVTDSKQVAESTLDSIGLKY